MAGRKTWREIRGKMSAEREGRIEKRKEELRKEMVLGELRRAREYTQTEIAHRLGVAQPSVSEMEQRADMYISTLRSFVHAVGGELDIIVRFPDGQDVHINQFEELGEKNERSREPAV